jgi:hypothetical protein
MTSHIGDMLLWLSRQLRSVALWVESAGEFEPGSDFKLNLKTLDVERDRMTPVRTNGYYKNTFAFERDTSMSDVVACVLFASSYWQHTQNSRTVVDHTQDYVVEVDWNVKFVPTPKTGNIPVWTRAVFEALRKRSGA